MPLPPMFHGAPGRHARGTAWTGRRLSMHGPRCPKLSGARVWRGAHRAARRACTMFRGRAGRARPPYPKPKPTSIISRVVISSSTSVSSRNTHSSVESVTADSASPSATPPALPGPQKNWLAAPARARAPRLAPLLHRRHTRTLRVL